MEGIYSKEKTRVMVYTRLPQQGSYPDGLAYSIHFAWSRDGKSYYPMNHNYGILFAKGEIGKDNTIKTKSLKILLFFLLAAKGLGFWRCGLKNTESRTKKAKAEFCTGRPVILFSLKRRKCCRCIRKR